MVEPILPLNNNRQGQGNLFDGSDDDELSHHHRVPSILDQLDWNDMTELIHGMDSKPGMSLDARQRAKQDQRMALSIRDKLMKENLLVRAPYKGDSFYIGSKDEFQQKTSIFIQQTGLYKFINDVHPTNPHVSQACLKNMMKQVDTTLTNLLRSQSITDDQYALMCPPRSPLLRLNYLYFVPETNKEEIPLQPIIICKHGPMTPIIRYLARLLWSMFNRMTGCQTFMDTADLVYALEQYVQHGYLQPTTHFVTFNIYHLGTNFSHERMIQALEKFLRIYTSEQEIVAESLTNDTIIQLIRLVLQNQFFIYENKLYQQIWGSASGSLLTIPLACISLFYGQSSSLIDALRKNKTNELFGRYRTDFFLTWKSSKDQLLTLFNETKVIPTIGSTVRLHDLELNHDHQGHLHTTIVHDLTTDDYELPDRFQYHTYEPSMLLKAALKHAVQCCSNEKDFQDEHRHLRMSYLTHGFSIPFIEELMHEFYQELDIHTHFNYLATTVPYDILRQKVLMHYEQQQQQNKKQNLRRNPDRKESDRPMTANTENAILQLLKKHLNVEATSPDIKLDVVPPPEIPLILTDYLADQRPSRRLLMLSDDDENEKYQERPD